MREIKFRAWNKEKKILVYENEDMSSCYWDGVDCSDIEMANCRFMNDEYVWMQYTGLKDKNGREIYEGDIARYYSLIQGRETLGQVHYVNGSFLIGECYLANKKVEIVGNIYEDSELLK